MSRVRKSQCNLWGDPVCMAVALSHALCQTGWVDWTPLCSWQALGLLFTCSLIVQMSLANLLCNFKFTADIFLCDAL